MIAVLYTIKVSKWVIDNQRLRVSVLSCSDLPFFAEMSRDSALVG